MRGNLMLAVEVSIFIWQNLTLCHSITTSCHDITVWRLKLELHVTEIIRKIILLIAWFFILDIQYWKWESHVASCAISISDWFLYIHFRRMWTMPCIARWSHTSVQLRDTTTPSWIRSVVTCPRCSWKTSGSAQSSGIGRRVQTRSCTIGNSL